MQQSKNQMETEKNLANYTVHLNMSESMPFSNNRDELGAIRLLAKEAKQKNILVYGLLVNYPKVIYPFSWIHWESPKKK
ncbi:D-ribitol-5-phosphate cytidylyltransferase-like isoform X2 [Acipenser ruthenus]|uniref:D-ribitol-5-phosphate cytidylyltransferase-like isoform X2 n=1 Tax=Acipenser ruthenus TaxID=7906 RepID=UPI00274196A0|nr:D-ribitol-5-phosphate cytidylyltransferase-like isoform X2 [Acipenser ruthenus]